MTVKAPKFIISECQRLIEALPYEYKKRAEEILEKWLEYNSPEDVLYLMETMLELERQYVYPQMVPKLFKRSHISESLIKAFKQQTQITEIKSMSEMVEKMANFELSWCEEDKCYDMDRTFWFVRSQKDWERVCARSKILPSEGTIKIALQIKKPKKNKSAEIACREVAEKFPENASAMCNCQIFFRQQEKAYYYIYLT